MVWLACSNPDKAEMDEVDTASGDQPSDEPSDTGGVEGQRYLVTTSI